MTYRDDVATTTVERPRRRQRAITTIGLVAAMLAGLMVPSSVMAARNCDSNVGNFFAGWAGNEGAFKIEGVSASLTYRTSNVCTFGGGNFDTGWMMLAGAEWFQYVQSGFLFDGSPLGCMRHFAQQSNDPNVFVTKTGSWHQRRRSPPSLAAIPAQLWWSYPQQHRHNSLH